MRKHLVQSIIDIIRKKPDARYQQLKDAVDFYGRSFALDNKVIKTIQTRTPVGQLVFYDKDKRDLQEYVNALDAKAIKPAEGKFRKHQMRVLELAKNLVAELEDIGLHPMLVGGALLGAVRNGGFIPWDDDIDIDLIWDEFEKLWDYAKEKYQCCDDSDCVRFDDQLALLDKKIQENPNSIVFIRKMTCISAYIGTSLEDCIAVDFFPREYVNPSLTAKEYKKYRGSQSLYFKNKLTYREKFEHAKNEIATNKKIYSDKSDLTAYGWGNIAFENYHFSIMKTEDISPLCEIEFEGCKFHTLKEYKEYLTDFYGDYMKLPAAMKLAEYIVNYNKYLQKHGRKFYISPDDV